MLPDDERHGTTAGRKRHQLDGETPCDPCKMAAARYQNLREIDILHGRPREVGMVGVQRRVQALMALGWGCPALAEMIGVSSAQVHKWTKPNAFVRSSTRDRIAAVYDELRDLEQPESRNAKYARTVATKHGWHPPRAWYDIDDPDEQPDLGYRHWRNHDEVDVVIVDRIMFGDYSLARAATKAERVEIVARWRADGRSLNDLERATGWEPRRYLERKTA